MKKPTYQEIADALGISKATVGYAMNHHPKVASATREKVLQMADRLHYRPDPALSALSRRRWGDKAGKPNTYSLALISIKHPTAGLQAASQVLRETVDEKAPAFGEAHRSMVEEARRLGYLFDAYRASSQKHLDELARRLFYQGVDGVILLHNDFTYEWTFPVEKFASLMLGQGNPRFRTHVVAPDWYGAMRLAVHKCLEKGFRKIAFANFHRGNPDADDRILAGFTTAYKEPAAPLPALVFAYPERLPIDYPHELRRFSEWIDRTQPEVILDSNTYVYWWLKDLGWSERYPLVHIHAKDISHFPETPSVDLRYDKLGRWCIHLLGNLIGMNEKGIPETPVRMTIPCEWYDPQAVLSRNNVPALPTMSGDPMNGRNGSGEKRSPT